MNVSLDNNRKDFLLASLSCRHKIFKATSCRDRRCTLVFLLTFTELSHLTRTCVIFNNIHDITCCRSTVQAQHFNRKSWRSCFDLLTLIINQGANLTELGSHNKNITNFKRTFLNQNSSNRTAPCFHF